MEWTEPSPLTTVFCPHCHTLVLDNPACPNGDWKRPHSADKPGTAVWQRTLDGEIGQPYFNLAASGKYLFCAVERGEIRDHRFSELIALDAQTGNTIWTQAFPENHFTRFLAIAGSLLISSSEHLSVLAGAEGQIQALDISTGAVQWQAAIPAHSHSAPAIVGDHLFISASNHHVYALNKENGAIIWESAPLPNWSPAPPALDDNALYIGGYTNMISRLTLQGRESVLFANASETDWFDIPFAYKDSTLFAPASRRLLAINTEDGRIRWEHTADRGVSAPPICGADQVYLPLKAHPSGRYSLRVLSLHDGQVCWEFEARKHILAPPLLLNDCLYFGSRGGGFYALDAASGNLLWEKSYPESVRTTTAVQGNLLYLGTAGGTLHCLRWRSEEETALLAPDSYRLEKQWLLAGTAAARREEWLDAAQDFERAAHPFVAAQLYERAQAWDQAAPLYAQSNHHRRALNAYQQSGDRRSEAEMQLQLHQPETAAAIFAGLGDHARAAAIYHEGGYLRRAAAQYELAGDSAEAVKIYLALKQPESAAQAAENAGDIDEAVVIWTDIGNFERAAGVLAGAGRRADGVDLLEANGRAQEAAALWADVGQFKKAAQVFDRASLWAEAAAYYEKANLPLKAAQAYFLAGEARQAADLYMKAGKLQKALAIYLQLQAYNMIAKIHEQQQDWQAAAQAYLAATPPRYEQAALCFVNSNSWAQAAQAYQDAGMVDEAVDNWRKSDTPRRAAELLQAEGRTAEAAALFSEVGSLQDAATLELQLGQIDAAVKHYRELGNDERAFQIARSYERWDLIGELARESGDFEQEAEAALALARLYPSEDYLHYRAAAHAFVRAAQQHEAREERLLSDEAIAQLWDKAAKYFDLGLADDKALIHQCQREAVRLRRWPEIAVEVMAERMLALDRWDGLIVRVKNTGFGVARHLTTKVIAGEFEGKLDTQIFSGILPNGMQEFRLNVRPRSAGSAVPLDIRISYMRDDHKIIGRDISAEVPVHDRDSQYATSESQIGRRKPINLHRDANYFDDDGPEKVIIVQGDYITVGEISDGTVSIGKGSSATSSSAPAVSKAETPAPDFSPALNALAEKIDANLTLDDITALATFLDIDVRSLPGTVKVEKAYALAKQMRDQNKLEPLFALLEAKFPAAELNWREGFK